MMMIGQLHVSAAPFNKNVPGTYSIGGWVGPEPAWIDGEENYLDHVVVENRNPSLQPVACRYTD